MVSRVGFFDRQLNLNAWFADETFLPGGWFSAEFETPDYRYAVGTAPWTWDTTAGTKWGYYSGGPGGAPIPAAANDVFFDANSGTGPCTYTPSTAQSVYSMDHTGYTGTFDMPYPSPDMTISGGNLIFASGATYSGSFPGFIFTGTGTQNVTSNAQSLPDYSFYLSGAGTLKFSDSLNCSIIGITYPGGPTAFGTIDFNNLSHTIKLLADSPSTTQTYNLGSGVITITVNGFNIHSGSTINPSTGKIKIIAIGTSTFDGAGKTYYDVEIAGLACTVTGSNTYNGTLSLTAPAGTTFLFAHGTTQTVAAGGFTTPANISNAYVIDSDDSVNAWTINDTSGTNSIYGTTVKRSIASGGASFLAYTTNGNVDGGSNSGWVFNPATGSLYYIGHLNGLSAGGGFFADRLGS